MICQWFLQAYFCSINIFKSLSTHSSISDQWYSTNLFQQLQIQKSLGIHQIKQLITNRGRCLNNKFVYNLRIMFLLVFICLAVGMIWRWLAIHINTGTIGMWVYIPTYFKQSLCIKVKFTLPPMNPLCARLGEYIGQKFTIMVLYQGRIKIFVAHRLK